MIDIRSIQHIRLISIPQSLSPLKAWVTRLLNIETAPKTTVQLIVVAHTLILPSCTQVLIDTAGNEWQILLVNNLADDIYLLTIRCTKTTKPNTFNPEKLKVLK